MVNFQFFTITNKLLGIAGLSLIALAVISILPQSAYATPEARVALCHEHHGDFQNKTERWSQHDSAT
jgi:hypothetical protein